jgi:hypothetical protein
MNGIPEATPIRLTEEERAELLSWGNDREPHYVRPRRSAHRGGSVSDQPDGLAPRYSITSLARTRSEVGISIPSAFAVFKFSSNSNFDSR